MMLSQHISDLLYRYECVIVPNFGAFITQTESARVHESTNAFYPPRKVVSFNAQLQKGDGLLLNHISTSEKISYNEASSKIEAFVRDAKAKIEQDGNILFENIGKFSKTDEGKLLFEPSYHINYLASSFGLGTFTSESIIREAILAEAEENLNETPVVKLPDATKKQRPYLKYAAVGVLALGIAGFFGLNYYSSQVESHNIAEQQKADAQLESKIQEATFVIDSPLQPVTVTVEKPKGNYHIVAGAFRVEANADKKVNQLKGKGFKARRIGQNKYGLHQVVYTSIADRLEALQSLRDIKRTENANAWLLVQELD